MSDLGTIGIAIEVRGRESLRQIENDMVVVERSAKSAARSFEAFERAGLKTAETFRYVSEATKKRLSDEEKITQELVKQRTAAEQLAKAKAASFQSQIGPNLGLGAQGISAGASASAFEGQIERLRTKYDQVYASSQLYERSLKEISQAHMLGVLNTKQHESAVEQLNAEYQAFQNGVAQAGNRFAQHMNQTSTGMNNFGVAAQQTGYQVSDFIVQVQSGTNPLVAFSQQATQLAGLLYLLPPSMQAARIGMAGFSISMATATAGLTILIPLLAMIAMNFIGSGKESEEAASKLDKQAQAYETLIQRIEELRIARQMEATGIQSQEEQILSNLINDLLEKRTAILERINNLEYAGGNARGAAYKQDAEAQRELLQAELDKNQAAIDAIEYERKLDIAARRRANEQRDAYREQKKAAEELYDRLFKITQIDLSAVFKEASPFAQGLLGKVGELYNKMLAIAYVESNQQGGAGFLANQYSLYGEGSMAARQATTESGSLYTPFPVSDVTSGGGTSKREVQLRKEIDLTKELTQAERDRQTIIRSVEGSLEDGFMAMVEGTKSVKDAFKQMAYEIIKELYRVLVIQRLVGGISGAIGMATLPAGPSTGTLGLPKFASGGSMMPNRPYIVGEHGPELVIPRHSGTVVNANQTAGAMGGGGSTVVNNNISVTGSDAAMVRAEVAKMIPQITNATKAAVIDARLRGGQMRAAFS